jgi:NAD+--asparagine ADP-ribosyltransferase
MMMSGLTDEYSSMPFQRYPIVKPNIRTGEGRMKYRPWSAYKMGDQKKKTHRKMAKKSRRTNRR